MRTTANLNEIIDQWLDNIDATQTTKHSYRSKVLLWLRWRSANELDPRTATRAQVIRYKNELESNKYSELTVDGYITAIKLFYKFCEAMSYHENIAAGIRSSHKTYTHRKLALEIEQAQALIQSIDTRTERGLRDKLIVSMMLFYGLRSCEVERLSIDDFSPEGLVRIQRKGRREKRDVIKVSQMILDQLEAYTSCRRFKPTDPLMVSHSHRNHEGRLSRHSISTMVKQRLKTIGIDSPKITAHSLRHTCGCMLIEQGVPVEDVRDILGHTDTTVTRIYVGAAQRQKLLKHNPSTNLETMILSAPKQTKE